jgi:hypothetical protein
LAEFPGKIAVISRLKKETFVTGNKGELIKSHVIPQCTVNIPEGAVNPGTMLDLQVSGLKHENYQTLTRMVVFSRSMTELIESVMATQSFSAAGILVYARSQSEKSLYFRIIPQFDIQKFFSPGAAS